MSWSELNAGATIPHEHATGCNSMQIPSSKQDTSWAPLGCSGETCSLSEETKSRTATASRASCHETRTTGESLPHSHRCVSSGGALPSTAVYDVSVGVRISAYIMVTIWDWVIIINISNSAGVGSACVKVSLTVRFKFRVTARGSGLELLLLLGLGLALMLGLVLGFSLGL